MRNTLPPAFLDSVLEAATSITQDGNIRVKLVAYQVGFAHLHLVASQIEEGFDLEKYANLTFIPSLRQALKIQRLMPTIYNPIKEQDGSLRINISRSP